MRAAFVCVAVSAIAVGILAGCGKSPEKVCDKFADLMKGAKDMPKGKDDLDACVQQMSEMKTKDPAGYACTADCVMGASEVAGAITCMSKCSPEKK